VLNGWFQGIGFPPCARTLTHWFSTRERGTKFGIWNTSHSIGAAATLLLCSGLVMVNWRLCFLVPGALALVGAAFLLQRLRDRPETLGLPEIEAYSARTLQVSRSRMLRTSAHLARVRTLRIGKGSAGAGGAGGTA